MKKKLIVTLILALTIMLVPAVSVQAPKKPIRCFARATYVPQPTHEWHGYIVFPGDPPEVYTLIWYADPEPRFVGHPGEMFPKHLEKFEETWEIKDEFDNTLASGYDRGIWSEDSYEFTMNGEVEEAYDVLSYLMGAQMHISGIAWIEDDTFQCIGEIKFSGYAG